jgi:hypothetical protein
VEDHVRVPVRQNFLGPVRNADPAGTAQPSEIGNVALQLSGIDIDSAYQFDVSTGENGPDGGEAYWSDAILNDS